MVYVIYTLYLASVVLIGLAVWRVVVQDREGAMRFVMAAVGAIIIAAFASWKQIGGEINETGYARVRAAAEQSSEADAMAQWALGDNVITLSEYATIADAYRSQTGRDINEEKLK